MPWIHVVAGQIATPESDRPSGERDNPTSAIAAAAADALGLESADVIVLLTTANSWSGEGAVAHVSGRRRTDSQEAALDAAVRSSVSRVLGVAADLVSVIRS